MLPVAGGCGFCNGLQVKGQCKKKTFKNKQMDTYTIRNGWLVLRTRPLRLHTLGLEDAALLQTLRAGVFRQMLEPPTYDGTHTLVEGRPMTGAAHRLDSLGFQRGTHTYTTVPYGSRTHDIRLS